MKKHEVTIHIAPDEFARVNRLLGIKSLQDMTDRELIEQGANTLQNEEIYCARFDDGSSLNFDLRSGIYDYWDDVVWRSPDGSEEIPVESDFELGDIKVEIESELYIVKIVQG